MMLLLLLLLLLKERRLGGGQDSLTRGGPRGPRGSGRHCCRGSMEHEKWPGSTQAPLEYRQRGLNFKLNPP